MSEFGSRLKQAREERGVSLRQIATATKISMGALEALERDDFSRLPGGIFSRAFVRAYALEVGLDPEQTVNEFLVEFEERGNQRAEMAAPEVTPDDRAFLERQRRAARILRNVSIAVVVVIAAAIVAWKVMREGPADVQTQPVETKATPAPASAPPPAPSESAAPADPAATTTLGPPTVQPASEAAPVAVKAGDSGDAIRLHVQLTGESWVRITVDGNLQTERTLQAGDTRDTIAGREIYLQVGNAGVVKWTINGRVAKELGRMGETASALVTQANMKTFLQ